MFVKNLDILSQSDSAEPSLTVETKAPRPPYSPLSVLKPTPKPALPPAQPAAAAPAPSDDSENVVIRCKLFSNKKFNKLLKKY
jgi:hypothetical protein